MPFPAQAKSMSVVVAVWLSFSLTRFYRIISKAIWTISGEGQLGYFEHVPIQENAILTYFHLTRIWLSFISHPIVLKNQEKSRREII